MASMKSINLYSDIPVIMVGWDRQKGSSLSIVPIWVIGCRVASLCDEQGKNRLTPELWNLFYTSSAGSFWVLRSELLIFVETT